MGAAIIGDRTAGSFALRAEVRGPYRSVVRPEQPAFFSNGEEGER